MVSRRLSRVEGCSGERGIVLYMVLVIVLLLLAAGAILGAHLQKRMAIFRDQQRNMHVQALLDTGMATAMAVMDQDFQYQGTQRLNIDDGTVTAHVAFSSVSGVRDVRITAKYRGETRRARAVVRVAPMAPPVVTSWKPVASWEPD